MAAKIYGQVTKDRYDIVMGRYRNFVASMGDADKEVVTVFDPLAQRQIEELNLIREVSKTLQEKKEEDMRKAAQAASQAEEESKKAAEAAKEEKPVEEDKKE